MKRPLEEIKKDINKKNSEIEELYKETQPTNEQYAIFRKVQKHYYLADLEDLLDEMLDNEEITGEEYDKVWQKASLVIEKYDKWLDYDWRDTMKQAISYVLEN